jgi:DNA excision repair protein ERCC-2
LAELKAFIKYRAKELGYEEEFQGLGLTSRKNLCLYLLIKKEKTGSIVDTRYRSLTAGFVRERKGCGEDVEVCIYYNIQ